LFSTGAQKKVSISSLVIGEEDIISVEFGGYSNDRDKSERDNDSGGDLRIMGIDVRDSKLGDLECFWTALVLSDSTVVVAPLKTSADLSYIGGVHR
jgi:hypothetical protein